MQPSRISRSAWWIARPTIRAVATALWRVKTSGEPFPTAPFVIAANHHSFLDPPIVGAAYGRRQRFITLVDLFGNYRSLDWILRTFEVIEVRRDTVPLSPLRQALTHLHNGGVVTVFPEGTRVWRFGDIQPRHGAAWLAVRARVPLVPVAVVGTDRVLGVDNKLHRGTVRVIVGEALHPIGADRAAVHDLTARWKAWIGFALASHESGR